MIFGTPETPSRDSTRLKKTTYGWANKNLSNQHRRPLSQILPSNLRKFCTCAFGVVLQKDLAISSVTC